MDIIGVDYSGAHDEWRNSKTWVTEGHMPAAGRLIIDRIQPILRNDLSALLEHAPPSTVAAFDFPFGLPRVFLEQSLDIHANTMREVWPHVANMPLNEYRNSCVGFGWHPLRTGDEHYHPPALSPLNTILVPMTYYGIGMLHNLDVDHPDRWWVPPLDPGQARADQITLLEVMPGAFLWSIGFDLATVIGPQSYKNDLVTREHVIREMCALAHIEIPNLLDFHLAFRANDDCLDSAVAALAAAAWATQPDAFLHPTPAELDDAMLEGWLYGINNAQP